MTRRWWLLLLGGLWLAPCGARAQTAPAAPTEPPAIDGFRSAHFGMDEAALRKAIETDFKLHGSAVHVRENAVQRTPVLSITVPDLVPDSGKATVDYILGYRSHRLIEVNIIWSTATDPANTATKLVQVGAVLQGYFQAETFPAGQTTVNAVLANGGVLLFRGTDAAGHLVALVLSGTLRQDAKDHKTQMTPNTLSLGYAADPMHPDVFRLQKGAF